MGSTELYGLGVVLGVLPKGFLQVSHFISFCLTYYLQDGRCLTPQADSDDAAVPQRSSESPIHKYRSCQCCDTKLIHNIYSLPPCRLTV